MIAVMPASQVATDVRLFDERDFLWIGELLTLVERTQGQPWRILLERIEHAPLRAGSREVTRRARQAITSALRRVLGGRAARARIARRLRANVLGHPALEPDARAARIAVAAAALGIEPIDVESLLWADLARERPVVLPGGRPAPRKLAAIANVDRIQRELRRAREIRLRVWDHAHGLVRMASRCGLITQTAHDAGGALLLRIAGPLALFHATTVYGRALGALVPLLADHARFELDIQCDFASGPHTRRVSPPLLLPAYSPRLAPSLADRLARDLVTREHVIDREPAPITVGDRVVFPDLAVDHAGTRWLVEVVGFSTADYLADKLALYRAANAHVVLCVDTKRSIDARGRGGCVEAGEGEGAADTARAHRGSIVDEHPSVLAFTRRIDADDLVQILEEAS